MEIFVARSAKGGILGNDDAANDEVRFRIRGEDLSLGLRFTKESRVALLGTLCCNDDDAVEALSAGGACWCAPIVISSPMCATASSHCERPIPASSCKCRRVMKLRPIHHNTRLFGSNSHIAGMAVVLYLVATFCLVA